MSLAALEVNRNAPEVVDAPEMAWEGSHLTRMQAIQTLDAVVQHAAGKPATDEVLSKVPLPEGITIEDARDCIYWAKQMKEARIADRADQRLTAATALQAALTVRARLKLAARNLLGKRNKPNKSRAKMAKHSRRMNRRR